MPLSWTVPEGLRVLPDGSWRVGDLPVVHPEGLRYLKAHLVVDDQGAAIVDGGRRMVVVLDGPPFEVVSLALDAKTGRVRALLDDGSEETVADESLAMNPETGRFECAARGRRTRAVLSRAAHQILLDQVVEEGGAFFLAVGPRRIPIRT